MDLLYISTCTFNSRAQASLMCCLNYCKRFLTGLPTVHCQHSNNQSDSVKTLGRSCHFSAQKSLIASHSLAFSKSLWMTVRFCMVQHPHLANFWLPCLLRSSYTGLCAVCQANQAAADQHLLFLLPWMLFPQSHGPLLYFLSASAQWWLSQEGFPWTAYFNLHSSMIICILSLKFSP